MINKEATKIKLEQKLFDLQIKLNYLEQQAELDRIKNQINLNTLDKIKVLKAKIDNNEKKLNEIYNSSDELFLNIKTVLDAEIELIKMKIDSFVNKFKF